MPLRPDSRASSSGSRLRCGRTDAARTEPTGTEAGTTPPDEPKQAPQEPPRPRRSSWAYLFQRLWEDLGAYIASPRRDLTYWSIIAVSTILTIGSDFLGVMRWLLSFNPQAARDLGFDQVYEVEGCKAYVQPGRYRLRYPGLWVFDQSVAFAKQAEFETPTYRTGPKRVVPDAAFGPIGGRQVQAENKNLSVVKQPIEAGTLEMGLGEPKQALDRLVREGLAPEGSGRSVQVLTAQKRPGTFGSVYEFEYLLTKPWKDGTIVLHSWSAATIGRPRPGDKQPLYTMTIVFPEAKMTEQDSKVFEDCWHSLEMLP